MRPAPLLPDWAQLAKQVDDTLANFAHGLNLMAEQMRATITEINRLPVRRDLVNARVYLGHRPISATVLAITY